MVRQWPGMFKSPGCNRGNRLHAFMAHVRAHLRTNRSNRLLGYNGYAVGTRSGP